ncbi:MAG: ECF transporter S component, partial [Clostridiales bacterium]|nr:ECF transporter S component [Clostridiales bacterium]
MSSTQSSRIPVRRLVVLAMMTALIWALMLTPMGFIAIPIFGVGMTTIHIPVLIGTLMEGLSSGTILGGMFGATSWFMAFRSADPSAVLFQNPLVSVLPRLLIGPVAYGAAVLVGRLFPGRRKLRYGASA